MVLYDEEAMSASSKPPAVMIACAPPWVEDAAFGALVTSLTRASPMHFSGARSSAILPKLVKLVRSSSTQADKASPNRRPS